MKSHRYRFTGPAAVLLALALGCASGVVSWEEARQEDSAAAYHRFLRENPKAPEAAEARERLALARLQAEPSAEGYLAFRADFPSSRLLEEVRPQLEDSMFEVARRRGTRAAYADFLSEFPDGRHAERARGNAEYLRQRGFDGRPAELADFAARYPESDFAAEARRSVEAVEARRQTAMRRVGLVLDVDAGTPGADRVRRSFSQRALRHFGARSVELVALRGPTDPGAARVDAILTIRHRERAVKADYSVASSTTPGVLATTEVTLARPGDSRPIASEKFELKASTGDVRAGESILFGRVGSEFWDDFYFPVSTWNSQLAVRTALPLPKEAVAVDSDENRAVALYADGGFSVVDLSDPANPRVVMRWVRPKDLSTWAGVRLQGTQVLIYGEAGVELVELASGSPVRVLDIDRGEVGGVVAVAPVSGGILIAGSRGILLARQGKAPQLLLEMKVLGADLGGDRLFFTDGVDLYGASLDHLRRQQAESKLPIGKGFGPERVRIVGAAGLIFGERGVLLVDLRNPARPVAVSRLSEREVGEVRDATTVAGRIFVLGDRGLQVGSSGRAAVEETVDVLARERLDSAGRHLVMVGDRKLQVVDSTPFVAVRGVAAPGR